MSRKEELQKRINRADEKRYHWIRRVQNAGSLKEFSRAMIQWEAWFNVTMWNLNELDREEKAK